MDARVKPAHDEVRDPSAVILAVMPEVRMIVTAHALHERAANAVRSLAPRSAAKRGEGWGEGQLAAPLTRTRLLVESCALSPLRGARARAATARLRHMTQWR